MGNSGSEKATALGALVTVEGCDLKQVRRVGATGAAYSLSFNPFVHFGLGECDEAIQVKVRWTNGETEVHTITSPRSRILN